MIQTLDDFEAFAFIAKVHTHSYSRIQPPSFSLIDNIICNYIGGTVDSTSGLLINDISDHKIIFTHLPRIK